MNEGLIEQRHPILGAVLRAWQEDCADPAELQEALAPYVARLGREDGAWRIDSSGAAVDALYGKSLAGAPVTGLTPGSDDGENEADVALESGRPLLVEQDIDLPDGKQRVIRLYLPLTGACAADDAVLCGIVSPD